MALALVGGLSACSPSGARSAAQPRRPSLLAESVPDAAYTSPARLRYHPRDRARTLAVRDLPDGRRLLVGERGERWVFDPRNPAGAALSAGAMLAPEPLIAALVDGSTYWFVGASGTSYAAPAGPLAPFTRSSAPVEALTSVSAAGSAVVGIRQQRALLRSGDFGVTWAQVGPDDRAFVDVALAPSGTGLALAVPEAYYRTQDYGATWSAVDVPPIGALELDVALDGSIRARTPLGERRWDGTRFERAPAERAPAKIPPPPRGPDAGALAEGRAALTGERYFELVGNVRDGWQLLTGPIDGRLEVLTLSFTTGCRYVRLAAFREHLTLACFRASAEAATQPIELWVSDDAGKSFDRVPGRLDGSLAAFRIAVGPGGRWMVSGVCPAGSFGSCTPSGVQVARDAASPSAPARSAREKAVAQAAGAPAATPSLADSALALGFSADGRVAYAVGRRTKTGKFALFVSRDGGKSFEPEDLDLGQLASDDDRDDDYIENSQGTRVEWLSAAEDGAVATSFVHYGRRTLVVTDDRGKLLSTAVPPEERALLSASGLRALAVSPRSRQVWESLDGGVTWEPAEPLPVDLCPGDEACDVPVRCGPHACVIGHEFTRLGWGRKQQDEASLLLPPLRPVRAPTERRVRTPIACTLENNPFRALLGVSEGPGAHDAAIGNAGWVAIAEDPNRASVTVYLANKGRVESVQLLAPVPRPEDYAYVVLDQVEGAAAIRYRVPEAVPGKTNLTDVEVVWHDVLAGRVGRARLADGGPYRTGDFVVGRGRAQRAQPELVSIAAGGLYLRLHARVPEQTTYFFDGKRVETLPFVNWPKDERYPSRAEIVHADGVHAPILFVGRGAAVVRAGRGADGWAYEAFATGMIDPAAFGLVQLSNIAYVGGRAGLHLEIQDPAASTSRAVVFPFRGQGPVLDTPVPVPTQRALGDRPASCDAESRKRTPRVVAAAQPGTRHPVIVTDSALGPRTMITDYAVLYGTETEPCAAAFEAYAVAPEGGHAPRESALILLDDLEHSVLFRVAGERENARIEHRSMACRFDPTLEIPPEIYRAAGGNTQ